MPSNTDIQAMLRKYMDGGSQQSLASMLAKVNMSPSKKPPAAEPVVTDAVTQKFSQDHIKRALDTAPKPEGQATAAQPQPQLHIPLAPNIQTHTDKEPKETVTAESTQQQEIRGTHKAQAKTQDNVLTSKNVTISETVEHYMAEPHRYLGAHSVETQTPPLLTEDNEVIRRLQADINYMKTQISCLHSELVKQFLNVENKLSALAAKK